MIGFTPQLVTAVWAGYDQGKPIELVAEKSYAKNIWAHFMEDALKGKPIKEFKAPKDGVVGVYVDPANGKLATSDCPEYRLTYFVSGTEPTEYCKDHLINTDLEQIKQNMNKNNKPEKAAQQHETLACGCPGTHTKKIQRKSDLNAAPIQAVLSAMESQLRQWPVQIKLVSPNAPYFDNANLLVAADCTAYAYANFHQDFMRNKITIIGCPKLDMVDYSEKLADILSFNEIKSVTVLRMEVPCCGGIVSAVKNALVSSGKMIPWQVVTIGTDGNILE
jgi:hypothetical protein